MAACRCHCLHKAVLKKNTHQVLWCRWHPYPGCIAILNRRFHLENDMLVFVATVNLYLLTLFSCTGCFSGLGIHLQRVSTTDLARFAKVFIDLCWYLVFFVHDWQLGRWRFRSRCCIHGAWGSQRYLFSYSIAASFHPSVSERSVSAELFLWLQWF